MLSSDSEIPSTFSSAAMSLRTRLPHRSANSTEWVAARMLCVGLFARYQDGSRIDTYVLLAEPGGANSNNTSSSPAKNASISLMIRWWCLAGSKPLYLAHSVRLLRVDLRLSSSSAAAVESMRSVICLNTISHDGRELGIAHRARIDFRKRLRDWLCWFSVSTIE